MSFNHEALAAGIYQSIEQNDFSLLEKAWDLHNPTPEIETSQFQTKDFRIQIIKLDNEKRIRQRLEAQQSINTYNFWLQFHQQKKVFSFKRNFLNRSQGPYISEQEAVTALMAAVERGEEDQVEFLLDNCPPNLLADLLKQTTTTGDTALHLAAKGGRKLIVSMLCEHHKKAGLDINTTNNVGQTPLQLAKDKNVIAFFTPPSNKTTVSSTPQTQQPVIKPTSRTLINNIAAHSNSAQEIQTAYNTALAEIGQYHGALQRCVRRINARIEELQTEIGSKKSILSRTIKRKKIHYLMELREEFSKTSISAPQTHPTAVIAAFRAKTPAESDASAYEIDKTPYEERYQSIVSGKLSKRTSELLAHLVGATASHEYLIERDAAHLVCKHLIDLLTKETIGKAPDPVKLNKISALEALCVAIKDVNQFQKSVATLAQEFKDNNPLYTDLVKGTNSRGANLMKLLATLNKKCEIEVRKSMELHTAMRRN